MTPTPLYNPRNIDSPAYHLRYAWTGWPSVGTFPDQPFEDFFADRFSDFLRSFTVADPSVRLQDPAKTYSGRYWYNLHVVLVTESRMRFTDKSSLNLIATTCDKVATKKSYELSSRSLMPDHVHLGLRGNIEHSPEEIALAFMNNVAFAFGQKTVFRPSYYVGTFGEYDMGAVRN